MGKVDLDPNVWRTTAPRLSPSLMRATQLFKKTEAIFLEKVYDVSVIPIV
jgi:hypothetical protein